MITSLLICAAFASQQFILPLPIWEAQTPSVRSSSAEYRVSLSNAETCTVSLTNDGNKVFIKASGLNKQGKPVKVNVQMTRAKYANGTELVVVFYDNRPDKTLEAAPFNQLDPYNLAFQYLPHERMRWFLSKYPHNLANFTTIIPLEQGSASAPIPKATTP